MLSLISLPRAALLKSFLTEVLFWHHILDMTIHAPWVWKYCEVLKEIPNGILILTNTSFTQLQKSQGPQITTVQNKVALSFQELNWNSGIIYQKNNIN